MWAVGRGARGWGSPGNVAFTQKPEVLETQPEGKEKQKCSRKMISVSLLYEAVNKQKHLLQDAEEVRDLLVNGTVPVGHQHIWKRTKTDKSVKTDLINFQKDQFPTNNSFDSTHPDSLFI